MLMIEWPYGEIKNKYIQNLEFLLLCSNHYGHNDDQISSKSLKTAQILTKLF